jgi:hypothetical protein
MFKHVVYSLALLCFFSAAPAIAQQPTQPEVGSAELKDIIRRAAVGMSEYTTGFKDLTAEEEQKVEEYDAQGKLQKQRLIASDLVIYQSQLDPTQMVEYRDVKAVDGVAIKKREARLVSLLNKSAKAGTVKKELDRVNRESSRYDLGFSFYGMTLHQGLTLNEKALAAFKFTFAGREQVDGHDAIVVEYQQVSETPYFAFNTASLPSPLKGSEALYRGRIWLDAETTQIRREVRELTLQPPSVNHPMVFIRYEFDYADSRFGFLTPKRIAITNYSRGRIGADKQPEFLLGGRITFAYGAFTRFNVDTPDASITPPLKP